jgi:hypothetical protein
MSRKQFLRKRMKLPQTPTPRPGDAVTWYVDAHRTTGNYRGYTAKAMPVVRNEFDVQATLASFDCVRLCDPDQRRGPNWQYLPDSCLFAPSPGERRRFEQLLSQVIPPGPTYQELVEEIWFRGYEVYLVGGTVRDVISGEDSNDVDLVTTMPLAKFRVLLASMFKKLVSVKNSTGFARLGGKGKEGDPFIDLKVFCHGGTGTPDALFGSDFNLDLGMRDFACNAIYYDPINRTLIDPSKRGIGDASGRILALVCNDSARSPEARGQVAIRYFKFKMRGFMGDPRSDIDLAKKFVPFISSMTNSHRLTYIKRQILGKISSDKHAEAIASLETAMTSSGYEHVWHQLFRPILVKQSANGGRQP